MEILTEFVTAVLRLAIPLTILVFVLGGYPIAWLVKTLIARADRAKPDPAQLIEMQERIDALEQAMNEVLEEQRFQHELLQPPKKPADVHERAR